MVLCQQFRFFISTSYALQLLHKKVLIIMKSGINRNLRAHSNLSIQSSNDRLTISKTLQSRMTQTEITKVRGAYVQYSNDQFILIREQIGNLLRSVGIVISNIELNKLIQVMNIPKMLGIDQLCEIYLKCKNKKGDLSQLQQAITKLTNGSAQIEISRLKKDLTILGDILTQQEFDEVINIVGNRNGYVSCRQLISILMSV